MHIPSSLYLVQCRSALWKAWGVACGLHILLLFLLEGLFIDLLSFSRKILHPPDASFMTPFNLLEIQENESGGREEGIDKERMSARFWTIFEEAKEWSEEERLTQLQRLASQVDALSSPSLEEVVRFFGGTPSSYQPRTEYKDELNPNINLAHARVTDAHLLESSLSSEETPDFQPRKSEARIQITFVDEEGDSMISTFQGEAVKRLFEAKAQFGKKPLFAGEEGGFELEGARIVMIDPDFAYPNSSETGCLLTLESATGDRLTLPLNGSWARPFVAEGRIRFFCAPDGTFPYRDAEETLHTERFDYESAVVYDVLDLTSSRGYPCAKQILIDRHGERLITILTQEEAQKALELGRALNLSPAIKRIYQEAGVKLFQNLLSPRLSPPSPKESNRIPFHDPQMPAKDSP